MKKARYTTGGKVHVQQKWKQKENMIERHARLAPSQGALIYTHRFAL